MMKNVRFLSTICISLLLILSIIQIFPGDVKIIRVASASSTWEDTNWSASNNYSKIQDLEQINSTGELLMELGVPGQDN